MSHKSDTISCTDIPSIAADMLVLRVYVCVCCVCMCVYVCVSISVLVCVSESVSE